MGSVNNNYSNGGHDNRRAAGGSCVTSEGIFFCAAGTFIICFVVGYHFGKDKGRRLAAEIILNLPAYEFALRVMEEITAEVDHLCGGDDQVEYERLSEKLEDLRDSLKDRMGKSMPELYQEHVVGEIKKLSKRIEDVEKRASYRVGKRHRNALSQIASVKIRKLFEEDQEEIKRNVLNGHMK
jgi:hypothetical protein